MYDQTAKFTTKRYLIEKKV